VWIDKPKDRPKDALGFDFDGADFTHVGNKVTFEVLLSSIGLDSDSALNHVLTQFRSRVGSHAFSKMPFQTGIPIFGGEYFEWRVRDGALTAGGNTSATFNIGKPATAPGALR